MPVHRQRSAVIEIRRLGGDVRYGESRFQAMEDFLPIDFVCSVEVVIIRRFDANFANEIDLMISSLQRLPNLRQVLAWEINHRQFVLELQEALPGVEIVVQRGGVVG